MSVHAHVGDRDALHANDHVNACVSGHADEHGGDRGYACVAVVIDGAIGAVMMGQGNDNDGGEHRPDDDSGDAQ